MRLVQFNKIDRAGYSETDEGVPVESFSPVVINLDCIRCFYPRHGGRSGTRITFTDGGGFAVQESAETIAAALGFIYIAPPAPAVPASAPVGETVN